MKRKIFIGTSGWVYPHWIGKFYPPDLPQKNWLFFYAKHFQTVEINATFYHQMKLSTFENWKKQVPESFFFSVKISRFITHIKKLKDLGKDNSEYFKEISQRLKKTLFLVQLPPGFKLNLERLDSFLQILPEKEKFVFEFRHKSWFSNKVYKLLSKYNAAWVIVDSPRYPCVEEVTADFVYIRLHGSQSLYSSCYTEEELQNWAKKIRRWNSQGKEVFVYFNNDVSGFAVLNAKRLIEIIRLNLFD